MFIKRINALMRRLGNWPILCNAIARSLEKQIQVVHESYCKPCAKKVIALFHGERLFARPRETSNETDPLLPAGNETCRAGLLKVSACN
jgi:hypothetical protein